MPERPCYQPQLPFEQIHLIHEGAREMGVPMTKYLRGIVDKHFAEAEELRSLWEKGLQRYTLDLSYEMFEQVKAIAEDTGRKPEEIITLAVLEYLERVEDELSISQDKCPS